MPEIVYKDESATDLRLHLIPGLVEKSRFSILKQGDLLLGDLLIEAHIIGASHMIRYDIQGRRLTEVLACTDGAAELDDNIYWGPTNKAGGKVDVTLCHDLEYSSCIDRIDWRQAADVRRDLEEDIVLAADRFNEIGLTFRFPRPDDSTPMPETLVWVRASDHASVDVRTAHSYPVEQSLVLTSTRIRLKSDAGRLRGNGGSR
jgi:hypothetical protein